MALFLLSEKKKKKKSTKRGQRERERLITSHLIFTFHLSLSLSLSLFLFLKTCNKLISVGSSPDNLYFFPNIIQLITNQKSHWGWAPSLRSLLLCAISDNIFRKQN